MEVSALAVSFGFYVLYYYNNVFYGLFINAVSFDSLGINTFLIYFTLLYSTPLYLHTTDIATLLICICSVYLGGY